jgi:hypothetical protein
MRVLVCHVRYRQAGGEDAVFDNEVDILRDAGVEVESLGLSSDDLGGLTRRARAEIVVRYPDHAWGRATIRRAIEQHRPDVVHFHNLYPLLGPAGRRGTGRGSVTPATGSPGRSASWPPARRAGSGSSSWATLCRCAGSL